MSKSRVTEAQMTCHAIFLHLLFESGPWRGWTMKEA